MKVLFVASEAFPLIKTGGLADVCGSLPVALKALGVDVRVLLPAYRNAVACAGKLKPVARLRVPDVDGEIGLHEGRLPGTPVKVWLIDHPPFYDRPGNPYLDPTGHPWADNAERFALLNRVACELALGRSTLKWRPDIVHCHDWQAGLVPALLSRDPKRPTTIFTIHNLAYQGLFSYGTFIALDLPRPLWSFDALEFHGNLSFIKGGLVFADRLTTVSPTYANEIRSSAFGHGLDGLLRHRADRLIGILNGIDTKLWNPARDPYLAARYSVRRLKDKRPNKRALQEEFGLPSDDDGVLVGMVGRMVHQKGIDQVIAALPVLMRENIQLVVLGTGEAQFERVLREAAARYSGRMKVLIGYDEPLAHRIEAGADIFLMPSRFEPCGLNQLYSLRYGTVPIVRRVGGLADTVVDATRDALHDGTATGIVFDGEDIEDLVAAVRRALALYAKPRTWRRLMQNGMRQDFSWKHSAGQYLTLYDQAMGGLIA
jgi:starch synthase